MTTSLIDLDHNATTPLLPEAWQAMQQAFEHGYGNPSSSHSVGRKARQYLEEARDRVAVCLGAASEEVIFTSGATEANNLALFGHATGVPGSIIAAPFEHPCVIEPLKKLETSGWQVRWLPVQADGRVGVEDVENALAPTTRLVVLMLANHEIGTIQPVADVTKLLPMTISSHCDAAQAVGKIPVNFRELNVTTLTASGHKFRGPKGVGLLLVRSGSKLQPHLLGGHQQRGIRPGTEAVPLAVGLATALEFAVQNLEQQTAHLRELQHCFLARLQAELPNLIINGPKPGSVDSLPTTLNLSFPGCRSELLLMSLDLAGVACSTGSACSSGSLLPSPVLEAMRVNMERLDSAMRFSFGPSLTVDEIEDAAKRVIASVKDICA